MVLYEELVQTESRGGGSGECTPREELGFSTVLQGRYLS